MPPSLKIKMSHVFSPSELYRSSPPPSPPSGGGGRAGGCVAAVRAPITPPPPAPSDVPVPGPEIDDLNFPLYDFIDDLLRV